jgi:glycosyltransferase involved in cell wall biosynthesis
VTGRAVIVFPDEWLPYSLTVLNLLTCLKERGYQTRVVTVRSGLFENFDRFKNDVDSFRIPPRLRRVLGRLRLYRLTKFLLFCLFFGREIRRSDVCFGIDGLGFVVARLFHKRPCFVSLEAVRDGWLRWAMRQGIHHVLIQTKERFDYLFADSANPPLCSILPNSPILEPFTPLPQSAHDLIYFGLIDPSHGVESCIDALDFLPESYSLTLKGPAGAGFVDALKIKYRRLFDAGRLKVELRYLANEEVIPYLSRFGAGFCFYDFRIIAANDFNYISCPSGKLYSYLAAGIPIIGIDILGLQVVRERNCGRLLQQPIPEAIAAAVLEIEADRAGYRQRCFEAAGDFDFKKHFDRFCSRAL